MRTPTRKRSLICSVLITFALLFTLTPTALAGAEGSPTGTTTTTVQPPQTSGRKPAVSAEVIRQWLAALKRAEAHRKHVEHLYKLMKAHHIANLFRIMKAHHIAELQRQRERSYPHGLCGGDLPPCYVMWRESRGDIHAQNRRSTASGKWQFLDSTWNYYGGYRKARYASERIQDAKARELWAGGAGCSHWLACSRR